MIRRVSSSSRSWTRSGKAIGAPPAAVGKIRAEDRARRTGKRLDRDLEGISAAPAGEKHHRQHVSGAEPRYLRPGHRSEFYPRSAPRPTGRQGPPFERGVGWYVVPARGYPPCVPWSTCELCGSWRRDVHRSRVLRKGICRRCYARAVQPLHQCGACGRTMRSQFRVSERVGLCQRCYRVSVAPQEACSRCGEVKQISARIGDDRAPLCQACYQLTLHQEHCGLCHKKRSVVARLADGAPICEPCYRSTRRPRAECASCGRTAIVQARRDDGAPLCSGCYVRELRPREECVECHELRVVSARTAAGPVCAPCRKRSRGLEICSVCGRRGRVSARDGQHVLYHSCRHRIRAEACSICGAQAGVAARDSEGRPLCRRCYYRKLAPKERCISCNDIREVGKQSDRGPLCSTCWSREKRARQRPEACSLCGESKKPVGKTATGQPVCRACYHRHLAPKEACARCGEVRQVGRRGEHGESICHRCASRLRRAAGRR